MMGSESDLYGSQTLLQSGLLRWREREGSYSSSALLKHGFFLCPHVTRALWTVEPGLTEVTSSPRQLDLPITASGPCSNLGL